MKVNTKMDENWFVSVLDKLNDVQNEVHLLMQEDCEAVLSPVVDLLNKAEDAILRLKKWQNIKQPRRQSKPCGQALPAGCRAARRRFGCSRKAQAGSHKLYASRRKLLLQASWCEVASRQRQVVRRFVQSVCTMKTYKFTVEKAFWKVIELEIRARSVSKPENLHGNRRRRY